MCVVSLFVWCLIALIEIKLRPSVLLKHVFFYSWPLMFVAFLCVNWSSLRPINNRVERAIVSLLLAIVSTPLCIYAATVLTVNFKFLIGGSL